METGIVGATLGVLYAEIGGLRHNFTYTAHKNGEPTRDARSLRANIQAATGGISLEIADMYMPFSPLAWRG